MVSIKLHSTVEHAWQNIRDHGHMRNYSAQQYEMHHRRAKRHYRSPNKQASTFDAQMVQREQVRCTQVDERTR